VSVAGDVIVVGTGVVGMATALVLGSADLRVSLVGPGLDPPAASLAAGAMLGVLGEHTAADENPDGLADLVFRDASARLWPALLDQIAEHCGISVPLHRGTVIVANFDNAADWENLDAIRRAGASIGLPVQSLDPRAVPGLRPAGRHAPVDALLCPDEGWVDTSILLPALQMACANHPRIRAVRHSAREVLVTGDAVTGVRLDDRTSILADQVILAAGFGTAALLAPLLANGLGSLPRVLPVLGFSLLVDIADNTPLPMVIRTPNRDFACGLHLVPRGSHSVYVGATNRFSLPDAGRYGITAGEQHNLLHGLLHQLRADLRGATILETMCGIRPATSDRCPLVGPTPLAGLLLATGTYRNGILMAPAVAALITSCVTGSRAPLDNPYLPNVRRPPRQLLDLVTEGAKQMASTFIEPHGELPYDREVHLANTLSGLLQLALTDDTSDRGRVQAAVASHPAVEGIFAIFQDYAP
jgi:glycine oxidase